MHDHGVLEEAVEELTSRVRVAAVEAEYELIQVGGRMLGAPAAVMSAVEPALHERGDAMHAGKTTCAGSLPWETAVASC